MESVFIQTSRIINKTKMKSSEILSQNGKRQLSGFNMYKYSQRNSKVRFDQFKKTYNMKSIAQNSDQQVAVEV